MITQKELHQYFDYNGKELIRKINSGPARAGDVAGYVEPKSGYGRIFFKGKTRLAHRLVWLHVYGEMPKIIDHINGNRTDNRICNLRNVCSKKNARNRKASKRSSTGITGVNLRRGRYRATIGVNNKCVVLGTFDSAEEALAARRRGELWYWGGTDKSPTLF